jgi:hypothetical protein
MQAVKDLHNLGPNVLEVLAMSYFIRRLAAGWEI